MACARPVPAEPPVRAGGLAPSAYLFGAEFTRESTRIQQQKNLEESLNRLERDLTISAEALALFIRHQLSVTAPIPEAHQQAARAQGRGVHTLTRPGCTTRSRDGSPS